jgi:lycopene cyclase domain-containing protein
MRYTYLLIDFFTLLFPFLLSFHRQSNFYKKWTACFTAMLITGTIFVLWDMYFTSIAVWGFNKRYVMGIYIGNLPLEEILFFICIPYACMFSYCRFYPDISKTPSRKAERIVSISLILIYTMVALVYHDRKYTFATFLVLVLVHLFAIYFLKVKWMAKFYIVYAFLLIPFLIVNGLLTGTALKEPVVWYNSQAIIGIRLLTIPVEDIFYGMDLILINILIFNAIQKRIDRQLSTN